MTMLFYTILILARMSTIPEENQKISLALSFPPSLLKVKGFFPTLAMVSHQKVMIYIVLTGYVLRGLLQWGGFHCILTIERSEAWGVWGACPPWE